MHPHTQLGPFTIRSTTLTTITILNLSFLLILYKPYQIQLLRYTKTSPFDTHIQVYLPASPSTRFSLLYQIIKFRYWPRYPYATLLHQLHSINAIPILEGYKEG